MDHPSFKRMCFLHYLAPFTAQVDLDAILAGDADSILKAVALLSFHQENLIYFVDFFQHFESWCMRLRSI